MASTEQLYDGLRNADAAGDAEATQRFADMIKEQGAQHKISALQDYNPQLGAAETAANLGTGVVAKVAGDVAGLAGIAGDATGLWKNDPSVTKSAVQNALTYEPRTAAGKFGAEYNPFALVGQGVGYVAKNIGDRVKDPEGEYPIASEMAGDALTEAIPQALNLLGARKVSSLPAKQATLDDLKAQNLARDATVARAKLMGYQFNPSTLNSNLSTHMLETLSGRPELNALLSKNNTEITNAAGRTYLGLPKTASLDPDTFTAVRQEAGSAHEALRGEGAIKLDPDFFKTLDDLEAKWTGAASSYPKTKNPAKPILDELRYAADDTTPLHSVDAGDTVDKIRDLRDGADSAYNAGNNHIGKIYKGAAKALEDQLDRGITSKLNSMNPASMDWAHFFDDKVANFRNARATIAKSYSVQSAMDGGDLSAIKLAGQLAKNKPLSGTLKTVAEVGKYFPNAVRAVSRSNASPVSYSDIRAGGIGSGIGASIATANPVLGVPLIFSSLIARPGLRHFEASKMGQGLLAHPNYKASRVVPVSTTLSGLDALTNQNKQEEE